MMYSVSFILGIAECNLLFTFGYILLLQFLNYSIPSFLVVNTI